MVSAMRAQPSPRPEESDLSFFAKSAAMAECAAESLTPASQTLPLHQGVRHGPQILVVCADVFLSHILTSILEKSNLSVESVDTMDEGCALAASGRFEVVLSQPRLPDGSWRRLMDLAGRGCLEFVVILVASKFDTRQWLQALKDGAFDVIDVLHDLDDVEESVRYALWVGYLSGIGPAPDSPEWREIGKR
jgi:CheY-like chemotaxis protein